MKRHPSGQHKRFRRVHHVKHPLLWLVFAVAICLPTLAFVDINDNGMSDIWEEQYNNGQLFPPNFDPQADADGDGWSNAKESVAGTDPFSPNPPAGYLSPQIARIPAVYVIPTGGGDPVLESPEAVTVTWPTVPGKHYTLQFSPDLQAASWQAVETGFTGNGNEVTYSFALDEPDKLFWRVAVTDVDSDNDGLTNAEEHRLGSNPAHADSDGDGLTDAIEHALGSNPVKSDTDGDGITDADEYAQGTNPNSANTDNDGIADSLDAIPWDGNIKWRPSPEARYAVIEIQDSGNLLKKTSAPQATDAILEHLGANGHLVFSRFDGTSMTPTTTAATGMAYPWECPWPKYSNFLWDPATGSIAALPDQVGTAGATTPGVGARVTHVDSSGKAHGNGIVSLETLYDSFDGQGVVWHPYTGPGAEYSPISWDSQTHALEFLPSNQNPFMTGYGENLRYGSPLHDTTTTGKDRGTAYLDNGTRLICITDAGTPGARTLKLIRGENQQTLGVDAYGMNIGYTNGYFSYAYEGNLLVQMVPDRVVHFTNSVAEHNFCCDRAGNVILATAKPQPATGIEFKLYCADGTTVIPLPATINSVSAVVQITDADASIPAALAYAPQYAFIGTESGNSTPALWVLAQAVTPIWQKITQRPRQAADTGTGSTNDYLAGRSINTRGEILHADGSKIFRNGQWHNIIDLVDKGTWGNHTFCLTQMNNDGMLAGTAGYSVKNASGSITSTVTTAVLLLPVDIRVRQDNVPGPHGSAPMYVTPKPDDGNAVGELFSLWQNEEAYITIAGQLASMIQAGNLPANYVKWSAPDLEVKTNAKEYKVTWGNTGLKEVKLEIGGSTYIVRINVPDTKAIDFKHDFLLDVPLREAIGNDAYFTIGLAGLEIQQRVIIRYGQTGGTGGARQDAIRHSSWNALGAAKVGKFNMIIFSTAAEYHGRYSVAAFASNATMDLHNNDIGASAGNLLVGAPHGEVAEDWIDTMEHEFEKGNLWIWTPSNLNVSSHFHILRKSTGTRIFPQ